MIQAILSKENFLKTHSDLNPECVVISILNPNDEPISDIILGRFKQHLSVQFHDLEEDFGNLKIISDETALSIRDFILKNKKERFIVHCLVGQSRSAGVAKAIECLCLFDGDVYTYKTSYQSFTQKPGFFPNNTVFDKILGVFNEKRKY